MLRCAAPPHAPGVVRLCLTLDGDARSRSNALPFRFRAPPAPAPAAGDADACVLFFRGRTGCMYLAKWVSQTRLPFWFRAPPAFAADDGACVPCRSGKEVLRVFGELLIIVIIII